MNLIFGYPGQDATLLAHFLDSRGEDFRLFAKRGSHPRLVRGDVTDAFRVKEVISGLRPTRIYFLAATHANSDNRKAQESQLGRDEIFAVNFEPLKTIREAVLENGLSSRLFFASSSLVFRPSNLPISEETQQDPDSFYAESKVAGRNFVAMSRGEFGLHWCSGLLFNHESHLRKPGFLSHRVIRHLLNTRRGGARSLRVKSAEAQVDWGYAPYFVRGMWALLNLERPQDLVFASGELKSVREFHDQAAKALSVDSRIESADRDSFEQQLSRCGDPSRISRLLKWRARDAFPEFVATLASDWEEYVAKRR